MSTEDDYLLETRVQAVTKNDMVELLGQPGVEGYEERLYHPGGARSGVTVGNGIDFAYQNTLSLKNAGIPPYLIAKIENLGILGIKGEEAAQRVADIGGFTQGVGLSSGEVALISNQVTQTGIEDIARKIGIVEWNSKPEGTKAAALSLKHLYGNAWYSHNSFKQFQAEDWPSFKANLADYKDTTPGFANGINRRHRIMSEYVPTMMAEETMEQEMNRKSAEMVEKNKESFGLDERDPNGLYSDDEGVPSTETIIDRGLNDVFYRPGK